MTIKERRFVNSEFVKNYLLGSRDLAINCLRDVVSTYPHTIDNLDNISLYTDSIVFLRAILNDLNLALSHYEEETSSSEKYVDFDDPTARLSMPH